MSEYNFNLVRENYPRNQRQLKNHSWIDNRPIEQFSDNLAIGAKFFIPGNRLLTAINTAIAIGQPLLVTGEPGTGKTQVAYYIAYKLDLGDVLHHQVKSTSKAQDLLYSFDAIRYYREAHVKDTDKKSLEKKSYIDEGPLWKAFVSPIPRVVLIDEIDKAPRDFPNDLLLELDQNKFNVPELGENATIENYNSNNRPIVIITSNSERRLPEPFLRRCIYHFIRFDEKLLEKAVNAREREYPEMNKEFLRMAISRFVELRKKPQLRKKPGTSELLTWLRIMAVASNTKPESLKGDLSNLPYLGALLKDRSDLEEIGVEQD